MCGGAYIDRERRGSVALTLCNLWALLLRAYKIQATKQLSPDPQSLEAQQAERAPKAWEVQPGRRLKGKGWEVRRALISPTGARF